MSNKTAYQIIFGNQTNGYYFCGQQLSATVIIENKLPKLIKEINATIRGRGRVKLSKRQKCEPIETYTLFSKTIPLQKSENNDFVLLPAGKYTYNISHQLSKEIPSSFSGKYGFVVYDVFLYLNETVFTLDSIFSQAFIVFNNNRIPIQKPPEQFQETTTICGYCCISQKALKMNITPLSNNCKTGDIVTFEVNFENESNEKVNEMRLKVYKNVEYTSTKETSFKVKQRITIEEKKEQAIDFSSEELCVFNVKIPFTQPSIQNQWINISYTISVETRLPTCCDDEIKAECPITIAIGNDEPEYHGTAMPVVTVQPTLAKNPILGGYQSPQLRYPTNNVGWTPQQNMTPYPSSTTTYPPSIQPVVGPSWNVSYPMAPTTTAPYSTEAKSFVPYPMPTTNNAPYPTPNRNVLTNNSTDTCANLNPISDPITNPSSTNIYNSPSKTVVISSPYHAEAPTTNQYTEGLSPQTQSAGTIAYPPQVSTGSSYPPYPSAIHSTAGVSISSDLFKSQLGYRPETSYTMHSDHKEHNFVSASNYKIPSESYQSSMSAATASDLYLSQKSTLRTEPPKTTSETSYKPIDYKADNMSVLHTTNYKTPSESFQSSIPSVITSDSYLSHKTSVPTDLYIENKDPSYNPIDESSSMLNTKPTGYTSIPDNINPDFSRSISNEMTPTSPSDPITAEFGETNIEGNTSSNTTAKSGRKKFYNRKKY